MNKKRIKETAIKNAYADADSIEIQSTAEGKSYLNFRYKYWLGILSQQERRKESMKKSKKWQLNPDDLKSIIITLGIAVLSFVLTEIIELIPNIDFGTHSEIISLVIIGVLKTLQKAASGR